MAVRAATLYGMYCSDCDWPFSPRKDGMIPKHAGAALALFGSSQVECAKSEKPAEKHGLRKPLHGNSRTMRCAGCDTRKKRGSDGRINTHKHRGRNCSGGRLG